MSTYLIFQGIFTARPKGDNYNLQQVRALSHLDESEHNVTPAGLVLCDDLIFFSRISGAANVAGLCVRQAKSSADLLALVKQHCPTGVIIDLQNPGLELASLLTEMTAICQIMPRVIAYGSHVEAAVLRTARQLGCDRVMPRSQFAEELDASIIDWLKTVE